MRTATTDRVCAYGERGMPTGSAASSLEGEVECGDQRLARFTA